MVEKIGKYEVIEVIGRGGMGMIFKARDPVLERAVALKVISSLEITPDIRARFFREARACARLRGHPNIVTIYDMGEDDGRLFIVMELLEGEELRQLMARRAPLSLADKLDIVRQICDGLHHAHEKGVVHRDIKPANIFLLRTGQVKILDFGIAQIAAATQGDLTRTGMIMGTLRYMAPEQVRGQADRRSDIFSVGAVSYELFSGRPPFAGEDPMQILEQLRTVTPPRLSELDPGLPSELSAVLDRAMQKAPGDRFADLEQMGRRLELVQRGLVEDSGRMRVGESAPPVVPASPATDPPVPTAAPARLTSAMDRAESTGGGRRHPSDTAWDTGPIAVRRAPRIAIGTGVAIAVIVAATLYWQLPSTPRGSPADKPAATVATADAVKGEAKDERRDGVGLVRSQARAESEVRSGESGAADAAKPRREIRQEAPVVSTSATSASSPSKVDGGSPVAREREKPSTVAVARSGPREDAEQARQRMTAARRAAERVAAEFYARRRVASAQSKERDGMAALGKSDYAAAIGLFAEAQSEYQAAAQEAPLEEEKERQLALLRTGLDQAHASAAAGRAQALAVEADHLAKDLFDQAQARQVEGDGLATRKELAAAAKAYRDAAERYGEAVLRARAARAPR
jgi:predicted Ser/Thr protein kinase